MEQCYFDQHQLYQEYSLFQAAPKVLRHRLGLDHIEGTLPVSFVQAKAFFYFEAKRLFYHSGLKYPNVSIHLHPLDV